MRYISLNHKRIPGLVLPLLFCLAPISFAQQTPDLYPQDVSDEAWVKAVPCRSDSERQGHGFIGEREFWICLWFDANSLQPQSDGTPSESELTINAYTKKGTNNLTGIELARQYVEDHPGLS